MRTFNCKLWTIAFGLCFSLSATTGVLAQQSVTITHTDLGSGIYMLKGQGGNIGLSVGADGAFMIDDQFAPLSNLLKAKVKELGSDSVNFVFNTHWHGDHTGGNENFSNSGSLIVAHKNVRKRLSTDQLMQAFNNTVNASPKEALPVITFANEINFHLNGEHIHVMHVKNAHTDGDAIIHFRNANVIHMGDTFFHGNYPFIDVSAGGTFKGLLKTIEKILALSDENTQIIP
ncbi:MAG: MBL fold metallo-hydrolase, partial [Gammaproteobacteria bacterium]|nr:MBL fold metallo-hydrolase [Gammaproteobacteria bacterium]